MSEVQQRDAQTLLPIIQQYIRPCSSVYSDEWRAYSELQSHNYSYKTVNNFLHFIDPVTEAHTQCVEILLGACKRMLHKEKTIHCVLFEM